MAEVAYGAADAGGAEWGLRGSAAGGVGVTIPGGAADGGGAPVVPFKKHWLR